jgi:hypothetical protein
MSKQDCLKRKREHFNEWKEHCLLNCEEVSYCEVFAEVKANQEMQDNLQKGDRIIARNRMAQLTALAESETICGEWRH